MLNKRHHASSSFALRARRARIRPRARPLSRRQTRRDPRAEVSAGVQPDDPRASSAAIRNTASAPLPLGGYVKMAGDNPDEARTGAPDEFLSKTKWERFQVLIMGPVDEPAAGPRRHGARPVPRRRRAGLPGSAARGRCRHAGLAGGAERTYSPAIASCRSTSRTWTRGSSSSSPSAPGQTAKCRSRSSATAASSSARSRRSCRRAGAASRSGDIGVVPDVASRTCSLSRRASPASAAVAGRRRHSRRRRRADDVSQASFARPLPRIPNGRWRSRSGGPASSKRSRSRRRRHGGDRLAGGPAG